MIEILMGAVAIALIVGVAALVGKAFVTFPMVLLVAALFVASVVAAYIFGGGIITVIHGDEYQSPEWAWWLFGGSVAVAMCAQFAREYW